MLAAALFFGHVRAARADTTGTLREVVRRGDPAEVARLLDSAPRERQDRDAAVALIWSAYFGRAELVNALLKRGVPADAVNDNGWTPLLAAVKADQPAIVDILLAHGADPNAQPKDGGASPAMLAAQLGRTSLTQRFQKSGGTPVKAAPPPPPVPLPNGPSWPIENAGNAVPPPVGRPRPQLHPELNEALLAAVKKGDAPAVKTVLDRGADPETRNKLGWPVVVLAASKGNVEILRSLYATGEFWDGVGCPNNWTPMMEAAANGHVDAVRFLLQSHTEIGGQNSLGETAYDLARLRGHPEIAALLRPGSDEPKADASPPGSVPAPPGSIFAAAEKGDTAAIAAALARGEAVDARNPRGWTPLISAVHADQPEAVRLLLSKGANPNALTMIGCSPLDFAVGQERLDCVPLLLAAGAEVNGFRVMLSTGDSASCLFMALEHHHLDLAATLLAHGARLEDQNNQGSTVLMEASKRPCPGDIRFLLGKGANVNARGHGGETALIYAAYNGCEENVRLLLANGADLKASGQDGPGEIRFGPSEVAAQQGHPYVLELLADAGVKPANNPLNDELDDALQQSDYERAQAALAKGASPSDPDTNSIRPLTVAVLKGDVSLVRLLIKAGADVNAQDDGDPRTTPMADAQEQIASATDPKQKENFEQVAEMLRQAHAKP
jgi:ankyrin repeat protein